MRKHLKGKHPDLFTESERKAADRMRANDTFEVDSDDSESQSIIGASKPQQPRTKSPREEPEKRKAQTKKVWDEDSIHQLRLATDITWWVYLLKGTYANKGGKSAAKENVIKAVDKYLGDAPA